MCKCNSNIRSPWCDNCRYVKPEIYPLVGEVRTEIKTVLIEMYCFCGKGIMKPTGHAYMSYPPQYPHQCTACGKTETFTKAYPCVGFEKPDGTLINE
jgi:hypothetical protein